MSKREDVIRTVQAVACFALDKADQAADAQDKYAVSTWNYVASMLLDVVEQAEVWDDDALDRIAKYLRD